VVTVLVVDAAIAVAADVAAAVATASLVADHAAGFSLSSFFSAAVATDLAANYIL